jgi:hypothetical protein
MQMAQINADSPQMTSPLAANLQLIDSYIPFTYTIFRSRDCGFVVSTNDEFRAATGAQPIPIRTRPKTFG